MKAFDSFLKVSEADAEVRETFARLAAEGRRLAGMSLREAAIEFRTAAGTVSRWENGYSAPPAISRREIISFYRTRVRRIRDASASENRRHTRSASDRSADSTAPMAATGPRSR
ncbi:MAG: hypothetical protein HY897_25985 [Deltaproteobacteria bacterium]|nr:hypothetical protein [Deltaproteobacteria bacterium]